MIASAVAVSLILSVHKATTAAITYDEAYTYLRFAKQPFAGILSDYHVPNNHILHSILVHFSVAVFGNATWSIRLPALAGGAALLAGVVALSRRFAEPVRTLWPVAVAFVPIVIEFNTLARGYSLGAACCLWALWLLIRADERLPNTDGRYRALVMVGLLLGLSVGFVPTFALFAVGTVAAAFLVRIVWRAGLTARQLTLDITALGVGALPVVAATYAQIDLEPGTWPWGHAETPRALADFWFRTLELPGQPSQTAAWLAAAFAAGLVIVSIWAALRRRSRPGLTILLVFVTSVAGLVALRSTVITVWPFPRSLTLLVPLLVFAPLFLLSNNGQALRSLRSVIAVVFTSWLLLWTATHWSSVYFQLWRVDAAIPGAVEAISADVGDPEHAIRLGRVWNLDVPILYELERRNIESWTPVPLEEEADYRILRGRDSTTDSGPIIFADPATNIRVQRSAS